MHRIEILRARYVLQLLVGYIVKKFQPKIPTYMSRRIFLSLLKKANFGQHKTSPNMKKKIETLKISEGIVIPKLFLINFIFQNSKIYFFPI